jgi:hypothetical protein
VGPRSNPQDTERPAERQAARFEQEKIWRGTAMSKGCAETVGDTSDDNPDPESPWKRRGQAARKGGRERGRKTRQLGRLPGESPGTDVRKISAEAKAVRLLERSLGTLFLFIIPASRIFSILPIQHLCISCAKTRTY